MNLACEDGNSKLVEVHSAIFIGYACQWLPNSLTDSLTHWLLFSKLDGLVWSQLLDDVANIYAACKDDNSNLLRLLLLLMLMLRKVLTTVLCRFGSWSLVINLNFVLTLSIRSGHLVKSLKLKFKQNLETKNWSGQYFAAWWGYKVNVWSGFWSQSLVEMLIFGWDFEFWNLIKICVRTCDFGKQNSTLGSVVPLAMFSD